MNTTQINIAIAVYLGAKWHEVPPKEGWAYRPKRILSFHEWRFDSPRCAPLPLPDGNGDATSTPRYSESMIDMYKAWKTLTPNQKFQHRGELSLIAAREAPNRPDCWIEDIAVEFGPEAFLRTVGRWVE